MKTNQHKKHLIAAFVLAACTMPVMAQSTPHVPLPGSTEAELVSQAPISWYNFTGGGVTERKSFSNEYTAEAVVYASDRSVTVRYMRPRDSGTSAATDLTDSLLDFSHYGWSTSGKVIEDEFITSYWPIDFQWIEGTQYALVTGVSTKDPDVTIFEVWIFDSVLPNVTGTINSAGTVGYTWVKPKRTNVRRILEKDLGLGGHPSFVIENKAKIHEWKFYMGIRGSHNIYNLELLTGNTSVAASDQSTLGAPLVAGYLANANWETCLGRVHSDEGYVYKVTPVQDHSSPYYAYLIDNDMDGDFDTWATFTDANPSSLYSFVDPKVTEEF